MTQTLLHPFLPRLKEEPPTQNADGSLLKNDFTTLGLFGMEYS